ncbi:competence protein ComE [Avibacterium gallinarum]|uniref:Competence protein ComEA n=1 Tax=Avibacterium gallinarum TaxID=755 RepID=A0A379AZR0_AVIGA|nr:helix-hairpin-helix domain-containing protein [Avibacterium gallinarum]POY43562.1 competence protein ComE [Avibacterium gallinarum]TDP28239.1 competence protein ComEA [Avibacterium gallinarum]SUB27302.1 putative competence protein ComEA [Avibacterium gallinarum]
MKIKTVLSSLLLSIGLLSSFSVVAQSQLNEKVSSSTDQVLTDTIKEKSFVGEKLNINTSTASDIQRSLVGIGAKKAEAIVEYREKHGKFTAVEQLLEVQGIGKATLEKNRERIDPLSFSEDSK